MAQRSHHNLKAQGLWALRSHLGLHLFYHYNHYNIKLYYIIIINILK